MAAAAGTAVVVSKPRTSAWSACTLPPRWPYMQPTAGTSLINPPVEFSRLRILMNGRPGGLDQLVAQPAIP